MLTFDEAKKMTPKQLRDAFRQKQWTTPTVGLALGYTQANMAILPKEMAFEFLLFCMRNPAPCPVLEVTEVGSPILKYLADGADIRTDLPRYRVYKKGELIDEPTDICDYWRDDFVAFLIGCSLSFEEALMAASVPVRHVEKGKDVPIYITNVQCQPAGRFSGPMVVSMRPMPREKIVRAVQVTTRFRDTHGAPVHIGDPSVIGIRDLQKNDFGDPPDVYPGEIPVFWGCGCTPQAVAMSCKPEIMITHYPSHMFVSDRLAGEITVL